MLPFSAVRTGRRLTPSKRTLEGISIPDASKKVGKRSVPTAKVGMEFPAGMVPTLLNEMFENIQDGEIVNSRSTLQL